MPYVYSEDTAMKGSTNSFVFKAAEQGIVSVSVTAPEGVSVAGRTVTATASGQTTQTRTIPSGATSVAFSLPAGTWTFSVDLPSSSYKTSSKTQTVADGRQYSVTLVIEAKQGVYGFRIAVNTADPAARVTYPETIFGQSNLAYGKTPASGTGANCMNDWAGCELITGIKRQTYTYSGSQGAFSDVSDKKMSVSGSYSSYKNYKDVMTYVPTWWMKMTNDGTNIDCAFSNTQIDDTWKDYAGSVGSNQVGYFRVGHFRVGCFAGYVNTDSEEALYSIGGKVPTVNKSITNFITYAKNRGTGYDIMTWYQWTYLAALATLLYKSTDLQTAMAAGCVSASSVQSEIALTFANDYGMYGTPGTSGTARMAFFWIQNLWGNIFQFIGGAKTDSSRRLMTCTGYSSVTDSDFDKTSLSPSLSSDLSGYLTKVVGTTDAGFFPASGGGTGTTYFADYGNASASYFPYVGGYYNDGKDAGPFNAYFGIRVSSSYPDAGSRLSYRL